MKYNASDELGKQYFKKYNCQGVPHLLFLDSNGNEVDRIIGFLPPTEYLMRIENIVKHENTLDDYLSRYENGEMNVDLIAGIALKYEERKENKEAAKYYSILIKEYPNPSSEYFIQGKYLCNECNDIVEERSHCNNLALLLSGSKLIDNNMVNFLNTLFGAITAYLILLLFF